MQVQHLPRRRLNYSKMRDHGTKDTGLLGKGLKEALKERRGDNMEVLSDKTPVVNREL